MSDLNDRIAQLPPEKRAILEQRLSEIALAAPRDSGIHGRESNEPAPLSFSQERLWFLAQLYPEQTTYNEASAFRLRGDLDVSALQAALDGLVRRHEVLRTIYHIQDSRLVQIIGAPQVVPMAMVDLSGIEEDERISSAQASFAAAIEEPFDLARDLVLRACLYQLDINDHILLIVRHHIASDASSSRQFWQDVDELYTAETTGQPARLPMLPVQYADFAVWQRERLQGEMLDQQLEYWRHKLADLAPLQLPTDFRRPQTLSFQGAGERFILDEALVEKLRLLARHERTTLHVLLTAAYAVLLFRMTSQDDIAIGVPVAGRVRVELEPLIGFFINTLVIRVQLHGQSSFRELLRQVRRTMLEALDHQEVPFERLVEALEPERSMNQNPLIATTFQFRDFAKAGPDLPRVTVQEIPVPDLHAKFDMDCSLVVHPDGVAGHWRYSTDLFEPTTIQRMIEHYRTLLAAIVEDPDCTIDKLPLLTDADRQQLFTFANTASPTPAQDGLVYELIEQQVVRSPEAPAVSLPDDDGAPEKTITITYAELNRRANQLARLLHNRGVCPGDTVALFVESDLSTLIAMLAILKAGGVYAPLDANLPAKRLEWMCTHLRPKAFLYQDRHDLALLSVDDEITHINIDHVPVTAQSESNLAVHIAPDDAAYVLFTSGSTGRPKAVQVPHRTLANLARWQQHHPRLSKSARTLQISSLTFDVSLQEILTTWAVGGTLVLPPSDLRRDPHQLLHFIAEKRIERLFMPYVLLQALADCAIDRHPILDSLCDIVSAGETLHLTPSIRTLMKSLPRCRLHNHYGPTESHVVSAHTLIGDCDEWLADAPIGRPIANTQIYLLDGHLQPVPVGVPGELYIGGAGLALGYLNQPDLTAERFISHPFSYALGARLYRTGDLARYRNDGVIEFLGRTDCQIKIRGFRIEPGEIEATLTRHPNIRTAVVFVSEDRPGDQRLVAYVVPTADDCSTDPADLRAFVSASLPDYMVPAAFVVLKQLPLTTHGKIDRRALPAPDTGAHQSGAPYVPPHTPMEEQLAEIWAEVLGLDRIGIHDNFFDIGGHSLLGIQLFARIEASLGRRLPPSLLFRAQTVAQLAEHLRQPDVAQPTVVVPLQPHGNRIPLFCVSLGSAGAEFRHLAQLLGPDQPLYGLQPIGLDDLASADTTIEAMATRYLEALKGIQPEGPYYLVGLCRSGLVAFEMARQLEASGERAALVAVLDGYAPAKYRRQSRALSLQRWRLIWQSIPYWLVTARNLDLGDIYWRAKKELIHLNIKRQRRFGVDAKFQLQDFVADRLALPEERRDFIKIIDQAARTYEPGPIQGRVTLFSARHRSFHLALFGSTDADYGWGSLAQGGVEIKVINGNHAFFLPPGVHALAAALRESLPAAGMPR